jgi:hypothetical protein
MSVNQTVVRSISARTLERQILEREGICVILLCPSSTKFAPYPYKKADLDKFSLAHFRDQRLIPHLQAGHSGKGVEFMIVKTPPEELTNAGRWKLGNLRALIQKTIKALDNVQ